MASGQENEERFQGIKYNQLGEHNDTPRSRKDDLRSKAWPFAAGLVTAIVIFILFQVVNSRSTASAKSPEEIEREEWNHCGRTSADAVARGCLMEPNFYGWFPSRCVFSELTDKYPVFEDRKWFVDVNLTQEISVTDLWEGKHAKIYTKRLVMEYYRPPTTPLFCVKTNS